MEAASDLFWYMCRIFGVCTSLLPKAIIMVDGFGIYACPFPVIIFLRRKTFKHAPDSISLSMSARKFLVRGTRSMLAKFPSSIDVVYRYRVICAGAELVLGECSVFGQLSCSSIDGTIHVALST